VTYAPSQLQSSASLPGFPRRNFASRTTSVVVPPPPGGKASYAHIGPRVVIGMGRLVRRAKAIVVPPPIDLDAEAMKKLTLIHGFTPRVFDVDYFTRKVKKVTFKLSGIRGRSKSLIIKYPAARPVLRRCKSAGRLQNATPETKEMRELRIKRNLAAIQMQRVARGFLVRMRVAMMRVAAVAAQRWYRVFFAVKRRAAMVIQHAVRSGQVFRALAVIKRMGFMWRHRRHRCARKVSSTALTARCRCWWYLPAGVSV
jgi:hypothetical protein